MMEEQYLTPDLFQPLSEGEKNLDTVVRPSLTYWQDAWRRFRKHKPALISAAILIIMLLATIVIPFVWPYSYDQQISNSDNLFPSLAHPFGTDQLGRDLFIRVIFGGRISLSIGIVASLINLLVGVIYGGISGYVGGKTDLIMMRIVEILSSVPLLLYVILLSVVLRDWMKDLFETSPFFSAFEDIGVELIMVYLVLGTVYWVGMARMVRGQVLAIKNNEYVMAARGMGASASRIIMKHLVPNAIGAIIVTMTMAIPDAIFTEAFLSFIGLGVSAPMASWGSLASDAYKSLASYPYLLLFPALAICLTMLTFNIMGDGMRDALDPKMRK